METAVISERLKELLSNKAVLAAVLTTYSFDPEFFELDVIPLLLPTNIPFSSEPRVKQFQVREALRDAGILLDVFYDLPLYRKEGQSSPAMEYGCHGVYLEGRAFHAKNIYILAYDRDYEVECLLVGAGSNNLTQSGWWDNIECQHWEVVYSGYTTRRFLNRLQADISYLDAVGVGVKDALDRVGRFLEGCSGAQGLDTIAYYNLEHAERYGGFLTFLRNQVKNWSYHNWTLEIISPYFSRQTDNVEHERFFEFGVQQIHLLLPINQEGEALVEEAYLTHIAEAEGISWAKWSDGTSHDLGMGGQTHRRLHAKVYYFYNKKQSWMFVGSVNFSKQAMQRNVESGFLIKLERPVQLLQPLDSVSAIPCSPSEEVPPGFEDDANTTPPIYLTFDWKVRELRGSVEAPNPLCIQILNAEHEPAIDPWILGSELELYSGETEPLETVLRNGSLVKVKVSSSGEEQWPDTVVLLQQTGWSHKPLSLPDLTAEEILAIYADLSPERRQLLLMNAQIKKLVLEQAAGELTLDESADRIEQFFSEYAEVFHAFRQLKKKLLSAQEAQNLVQVDYYLTGSGVDSLPTLIEHAVEEKSDADKPMLPAVTAYLILLSVKEIYNQKDFRRRTLVKQKTRDLGQKIEALKKGNRIVLENNTPEARTKFFDWFETQFSKEYRTRISS